MNTSGSLFPAAECPPRDRARTKQQPYGGGDWVIEFDRPEPDLPPFTTLAWRLCHLASGMTMRADYTTGTRAMTWEDYRARQCGWWDASPTRMRHVAGDARRDDRCGPDQVGRSQFPRGLDP